MRKYDKKAMSTVARANQLAEQRHIASRSLIEEFGEVSQDDMSATEFINRLRENIGDENIKRLYLLGVKASRDEQVKNIADKF